EGYPYGSFVTVAFDNGNPVFLISGLAEHTRNLERDPRASLLMAESGAADPLANGRVTLLGRCTQVEGNGASARAAFFAAHPSAASMKGIDRYGFEMSASTAAGPRPIRLAFATPVSTPEEARAALVAMVKDARSNLS